MQCVQYCDAVLLISPVFVKEQKEREREIDALLTRGELRHPSASMS